MRRAHHSDPEPADLDIRAGLADVLTRGGQQASNRTHPAGGATQPSVRADPTQGDGPAQKEPKKHVSRRPTGRSPGSRRSRWTLAEKINRLFETLHPPGRGPWSNQEVERWLAERVAVDGDGLTISANYLLLLRNGQQDNPTMRHVQAMAKFFRIDPGYFLHDDAESEQIYADLQLLGAIRDNEQDMSIALSVFDLDLEIREWLAHKSNDLPRGRRRRQRNPGAGQRSETGHPPADADPE